MVNSLVAERSGPDQAFGVIRRDGTHVLYTAGKLDDTGRGRPVPMPIVDAPAQVDPPPPAAAFAPAPTPLGRKPRRLFQGLMSSRAAQIFGLSQILLLFAATPMGGFSSGQTIYKVVMWSLVVVVGVFFITSVVAVLERIRFRVRRRRNLCIECAYPRQGLKDEEPCSECGAAAWF